MEPFEFSMLIPRLMEADVVSGAALDDTKREACVLAMMKKINVRFLFNRKEYFVEWKKLLDLVKSS